MLDKINNFLLGLWHQLISVSSLDLIPVLFPERAPFFPDNSRPQLKRPLSVPLGSLIIMY